jgi:flavin-dependent dehydrogenase
LIDAAREAGAEVRHRFRVQELVWHDGRVTGVRGRAGTELARLVIGADGKRSFVADAVAARQYRQRPVRSFASYTYWYRIRECTHRARAFAAARPDLEGHYLAVLDRCHDLGDRVRAEHLRTTPDQPNMFRVPHGPGWALVGDADVVMDSVSAQGIINALCEAERLSAAVVAGLGGGRRLTTALADHHRERDRAIRPMYDLTTQLA